MEGLGDGRFEKTTGISLNSPRNGTHFRYFVPPTTWVTRAVMLSHARALTVKTLCVPASRSADLLLAMKLHHEAGFVATEAEPHNRFKPRLRHLPGRVLAVPLRLVPPFISQPLPITCSERDFHKKWCRPSASKNNRELSLLPHPSKVIA